MNERSQESCNDEVVQRMFSRNQLALAKGSTARIAATRVAVIGIGGIGSVVAEQLVRLGVRSILLAARGTYELENMNRQIPATLVSVKSGTPKVSAMAERMYSINHDLRLRPLHIDVAAERERLSKSLAEFKPDIIFNCVDEYLAQQVAAGIAKSLGVRMLLGGVVGVGHSGVVTGFSGAGSDYNDIFAVNELAGAEDLDLRIKRRWLEKYAEELQATTRGLYEEDIRTAYPVVTPVPWILASLSITEFLKAILQEEAIEAPQAVFVDTRRREMKVVDLRTKEKWSFVPWRP